MNANVSFTICPNVPRDFTLKVLLFTNFSNNPSETLHIHCCHLVDTIRITTRVMAITTTFLLHFKDGGRKREVVFFFIFSSTRSIVLYSPTFNSHFHKRQSWLSNDTKNMLILASGPELQAVRFGYVI